MLILSTPKSSNWVQLAIKPLFLWWSPHSSLQELYARARGLPAPLAASLTSTRSHCGLPVRLVASFVEPLMSGSRQATGGVCTCFGMVNLTLDLDNRDLVSYLVLAIRDLNLVHSVNLHIALTAMQPH